MIDPKPYFTATLHILKLKNTMLFNLILTNIEVLCNIKGKFILTYNDCDYVRQTYKDFNIIEIERNHNLVAKNGETRYKELIIKNF